MSKKIPIEDVIGVYTIVDDEDYKELSKYHWYIFTGGYAYNEKLGKMHRFLMNPDSGLVVDHINHNRLDNRKCNLRVCTQQQNQFNRRPKSDSRTGYKGVKICTLDSGKKKYKASICCDGIQHYYGWFDTPEEAAAEYNKWALYYFGEYAYLNPLPDHEGD